MSTQDWNFVMKSPKAGEEAYVGLREENEVVTLWVPHGYPEGANVEDKHQILGELMRVVIRFSEAFHGKVKCSTRDGWLKADGGQSFNFDGPALGYTHLDRYLKLIRMLRDPRLLAIIKAPGLTTQFDHRYIARNLERAMFLPDGTPVFDLSWAPRTQMRHTGNDMVGLACWMALDALELLSAEQEVGTALHFEWEALAHRFADEHELDVDASLFSDKRKDTLPLLQAALETCVRLAPPVSTDARELHHLLDELLYYALSGQDGDIWGLKGFHHVWESACLEHAIAQYGIDKIFTCDDTFLPDIGQSIRKRWKDNRHRIFAKNGTARCPDLVVKDDDDYRIVDFKYYAKEESAKFIEERPPAPDFDLCKKNHNDFCRKLKAYQDIASVEAYRWLLMQHAPTDEGKVTLELWVPGEKLNPREKNIEGKLSCWQAKDRDGYLLGDSTKFNNLTLIYKPARKILSAYAEKFHLMD